MLFLVFLTPSLFAAMKKEVPQSESKTETQKNDEFDQLSGMELKSGQKGLQFLLLGGDLGLSGTFLLSENLAVHPGFFFRHMDKEYNDIGGVLREKTTLWGINGEFQFLFPVHPGAWLYFSFGGAYGSGKSELLSDGFYNYRMIDMTKDNFTNWDWFAGIGAQIALRSCLHLRADSDLLFRKSEGGFQNYRENQEIRNRLGVIYLLSACQ